MAETVGAILVTEPSRDAMEARDEITIIGSTRRPTSGSGIGVSIWRGSVIIVIKSGWTGRRTRHPSTHLYFYIAFMESSKQHCAPPTLLSVPRQDKANTLLCLWRDELRFGHDGEAHATLCILVRLTVVGDQFGHRIEQRLDHRMRALHVSL